MIIYLLIANVILLTVCIWLIMALYRAEAVIREIAKEKRYWADLEYNEGRDNRI